MPDEQHVESSEAPHNSLSLKAVLLLVILVSLILAAFSYWLYLRDPNYKYDLARPDVKKTVKLDEEDKLVDEHSKVDEETVKGTQILVEQSLEDLNGLDSFQPAPLSDGTLAAN